MEFDEKIGQAAVVGHTDRPVASLHTTSPFYSLSPFSHARFPKAPPSLSVLTFNPFLTGPAASFVQSWSVLPPLPIWSPTPPSALTPPVCKVSREPLGRGLLPPDHVCDSPGKGGFSQLGYLGFLQLGYGGCCPVITLPPCFFVCTEMSLQSHNLTPLGSWIPLLTPVMKIIVSGKLRQMLGSCTVIFIGIINLQIFSRQIVVLEDLCGLSFG